jgi:hypothetical protein
MRRYMTTNATEPARAFTLAAPPPAFAAERGLRHRPAHLPAHLH